MFGTKGYKAREAAAAARSERRLTTAEIRAQRAAALPEPEAPLEQIKPLVVVSQADADQLAALKAQIEADDKAAVEAAAAQEAAEKAAAEQKAADEKAAAEQAEKEAAEAAAKEAAEKEAAEKVAAEKAAKKAAAKGK